MPEFGKHPLCFDFCHFGIQINTKALSMAGIEVFECAPSNARGYVIVIDISTSLYPHLSLLKQVLCEHVSSINAPLNIIAFGTQVSMWESKCELPSPKNIERLKKWIMALRCSSGTNTHAALCALHEDSNASHAVLLSDGMCAV